ncbi:hypothetical protein [Enterobacter kobei]|uniref:hypothetical protein n=1 Tax=Enterobacter kobei TaxID=208224 RepID=UPI00388EBBBB
MMLSRCRHPAQRWRVARMQLRQVARQGAHCCADTPGVQGANRRRASGMMLSRCRHPAQLAGVARMQPGMPQTGGALLRRYARRSGYRRRASHDAEPLPPPGAALAVARMQLRQVAGRGRTAAQIRPAFRVRTVAAPAA